MTNHPRFSLSRYDRAVVGACVVFLLGTVPGRAQTLPAKAATVRPVETLGSVKKLRARIAALEADVAVREKKQDAAYALAVARAKKNKTALPPKPAEIESGTDYWEAYLYYLEQRAFPNDEIDLDALYAASEERDAMPAFTDLAKRLAGANKTSGIRGSESLARVPTPPAVWQFIGPRNLTTPYQTYYGPSSSATSGRINGIAYHPTDSNTAYIASGGGGVWKTVDGGANWVSVDKGFPTQNTSCVAVDPTGIVYVGLGDFDGGRGDGGGVMKSVDGGANWTRLDSTNSAFVNNRISAIAIDPDNANRLVATGGNSSVASAIFLSTNAGATWASVGNVLGGTFSDVEISPVKTSASDATQPNRRFYYATNSYNLVTRSTGAGASGTWANISLPTTNLGEMEIAVSATDPNVVYLSNSGAYDYNNGYYTDRNVYKGVRNPATDTYTWTTITGALPSALSSSPYYNWSQAYYDHSLVAVAQQTTTGAPVSDFLYSSLITLAGKRGTNDWQDIGVTYTNGAKTHNDQHAFAAFPGDLNKMLFGNDGGVYGLTYNPATGAYTINDRLSATIGVTMFYHADFHPTNPNWAIGGAQDNATPFLKGDSANWLNKGGGDGGGSAINPIDPLRQYATVQGGGFYYTNNGWNSTGSTSLPLVKDGAGKDVNDGAFTARITIDPNFPNPVYYGGNNYLHRFDTSSRGGGGSFQTKLGGVDFGNQIIAITVAPSNSRIIYVGTTGGRLSRSTDYGATWTTINGVLPNRARTDIWVNPTNAADVVVVLSGTGSAHVWRTTTGLAATPTWTSISGSGAGALPDTPTNSVTRDPFDTTGSTFYIGTDVGVFATSDGGLNWANATAPLGLPNVTVTTLRAISGTGYLMASTYGRGMWRIPLTVNVPDAKPDLRITQSQTRSGSVINVTITATNVGGIAPSTLALSLAELRVNGVVTSTTTTMPRTMTPAAPGSSSSVVVSFPASVGTAGTAARFTLLGNYTFGAQNGTFGGTYATTLP